LYNVYYPEDTAKDPIGIVFHKDKFYQFFHSTTTGNPYLGALLKEANQYEFQDDISTEDEEDKGAKEQLTLQICNSLVTIDQGQPGSPERTREPWAPDRMPTITSTTTLTPTTYTAQQTQSRLPMATETITRTLTESAQEHEIARELAQPSNGPGGDGRSVPFGADRLGSSQYTKGQVRATIIDAFRRRLGPRQARSGGGGGGPPDGDDNDSDGGASDEEPNGNHLQDMVPIPQAHDVKAMGSLPRIFDGDRTWAKAFLTEFLGYLILNQGVPGFESPIRQVALALTLIKGEKVNLWVRNMIDTLRRLHPVHHNVPAVWDEFEQAFKDKFVESTHELRARNQLEQLKFKYPNINEYIANFEDLIVHAGYNLASKETINLFLKGFSKNRGLLDKVFTPPVLTAYGAMKRRLIAIIKSMQLVNSIAQNAPDFQRFGNNNTQQRFQPRNSQPARGFMPRQVTSSNTPPWMNNMAVPMDTSNRARAPRQQGNQGRGAYRNAVQTDQGPPKQWPPCKCFTCNCVGHLARDCHAKNAQINSVIDEPEDMNNVQAPITPEGILDNALSMFDRLSEDIKDQFIQRYEGKLQDF
jgi:hypothetical protein